MGSHPIGLEATADINPAPSLSTQTVTVYTRHHESCSKNGEPYWKRCHCMKYLYVYRENTSRQVSAKTRSWERAEQRAQEIRDSWSPVKALGLQGHVSESSIDPTKKGKKAGTVVLQAQTGNLSLSIGLCTFVYEEPREAKPVVRAEAEDTTVSALSVFFPSNEVFVFYELREPLGKTSLPAWSTI